jgi:two-component system sensor histidine kinase BaeS
VKSHRSPPCPPRPAWWPENAPIRRGRFFRRAALVVFVLMLLGGAALWALAWLAATALGIAPALQSGAGPLLAAAGVFAVAALLLLLTLLRRIGVPIGAVMEAADRVAAGDYAVRVAEYGPPSVRALARAFNTMTARLASHDRLRRDLMADVAHELRTPLTVLQGRLEGLLDGIYARDDDQLTVLLEETRILSRLIEDLRTLALSESGALKLEKEVLDVAAVARDVARRFEADAAARGIALDVQVRGEPPAVPMDRVRIQEVLSNLITNALRHTPEHGGIDVHVAATPDGGVEIAVHDTGSGMTPDQIERAFERFHKGPGSRGTGLGLTIARTLVAAHGGTIHLESGPGRGTTATFTLTGQEGQDGRDGQDGMITP